MFNEYVWQLYLHAGGSKVVELFELNLTNGLTKTYGESISKLRSIYCPMKGVLEGTSHMLHEIADDVQGGGTLLNEGEYSIETALQFVYEEIKGEENYSDKDIFQYFSDNIECFTTILALELPELFIPYYFKLNFNVLEKIAEEFGVALPKIPAKRDYKERLFYYGEICAALYDFREAHRLNPYELCAFLYDFAPQYIGGIDSYIVHQLPQPKGAYFIGGGKDDCFLADDQEEIVCWQCSPDTMAGDMIVMYLRTPVSAVDSVWRSVSVGFDDPFFFYYRCTYISRPQKIKRISQEEIKQDPVFAELPIVKKNMQGINGVELYPSVYNRLIDMAKADVPKLENIEYKERTCLAREKDVEDRLIKPFLRNLGYGEDEYSQQVVVRIGNHQNKLIPDFVVHPKLTAGHQSADFLVEAKYSITTSKQLEEAKTQARSYAKLFSPKYSIVASKERIWVTSDEDDYSKDLLSFSWEELENADNFHEVFALLGKGKFNK